jgi:hypothetical protein
MAERLDNNDAIVGKKIIRFIAQFHLVSGGNQNPTEYQISNEMERLFDFFSKNLNDGGELVWVKKNGEMIKMDSDMVDAIQLAVIDHETLKVTQRDKI